MGTGKKMKVGWGSFDFLSDYIFADRSLTITVFLAIAKLSLSNNVF